MTVLIIGGGLSGLALAEMLEQQGRDYLLIEARDRFGGRIMSEAYGADRFDMGPAWFWPGQPRITTLTERLGLRRFDQYAEGILTFEDAQGQVQREQGFASMQGSWRLEGGLSRLTDALAVKLPATRKRLQADVAAVAMRAGGVTVTLAGGESVTGDRVVLALPPRVAARISFAPILPDRAVQAMAAVPTWMAGQAKALAVYDKPFWREAGLSGDAMSRRGPMVEVHDASPLDGETFALFGFIGIPPEGRRDEAMLRQHLIAQLIRLFGEQADAPLALFVKDWALDPLTATATDRRPLNAHPAYGLPLALRDLWDGKLQFAGTEVAPEFGGYIEGALEAAENVLDLLG